MSILAIQTAAPTGLASVNPEVIYILTSDTYATVTATGYLTQQAAAGYTFNNYQMALVYTSDNGPVWLKIVITYSGATIQNKVVSLVQISSPGDIVLPTILNHLIVSTDTAGTLGNLTGTAINNGSIQAGLSGTAGTLISFPGTASKGSLVLAAVANTGDTLVTISNALHGQASVYSIPDSAASTANILISKLTGTQHITIGAFAVDAGVISSGIGTGGTAGGFIAYPATTTNGSLRLTPVGNVGNFNAIISDITGLGQSSTYTLPDPGNAAARILVGATATPFTTAHILASSGTGGLVADSGIATSAVQLNTNIKAVRSADIGGGGAGPITITQAGVVATSVIVANIVSSSNTVSITKVTPGTGNFTVLFSGDPGAACILNYIVFIAQQ
jgi:hypothetical protein